MKSFVESLTDETSTLRGGGTDAVNLLLGHDDPRVVMLRHDDILMPLWREFVDSLQLYPALPPTETNSDSTNNGGGGLFHLGNNRGGNFYLSNVQVSSDILRMLTPSLKMKHFYSLMLHNNGFDNPTEGINFAIEFAKSNRGLRELNWLKNSIGSIDNLDRLVQSLVQHPQLECVFFNECWDETVSGYRLLHALTSRENHFTSVYVTSNNLRTGGSTHLPDYLASNPYLKDLCLCDNHLDDNDATLIATAL
ncbi:hypothetical protein ACHAWF_000815, partial [Thalassiosira exigua]